MTTFDKFMGFVVALVIFSLIVGAGVLIWRISIAGEKQEAAKLVWYTAHACVESGYIPHGNYQPVRLYSCNNGKVYIWRDIPTE